MPDSEIVAGLPEPAQAPEKPSAKYPTRELGRLIKFYRENVRNCNSNEQIGVIKNIQRILDKGIPLEDIVLAMQNYAEARKGKDPQYTMMLRTFFSEARVKEWIDPPKWTPPAKPTLPQIAFQALEKPKPVTPTLFTQIEEEDDEL